MIRAIEKGFTLIELMVVIAIIGILSMYALTAYQDYIKRAYVTEGIQLAAGVKLAWIESYYARGKSPSSNAQAGLAPPTSIKGQSAISIKINPIGEIIITYDDKVTINPSIPGQIILYPKNRWDLNGQNTIEWDCYFYGIHEQHVPLNCIYGLSP